MPTLPLLTPTTDPTAARQVRAPGGYESTYFMTTSRDGGMHLIAGLHFGYPLDRRYARRYLLYRKFPTRISPPEPMSYASATLSVMLQGRVLCRMFQRVRSHDAVRVDKADGSTELSIGGFDLAIGRRATLNCEALDDGPHRAVVTALCDVSARLGWVLFEGYGCCDRRWGTRWPRETGGVSSAAVVTKEQARIVYGFGERAHLLEVTHDAYKRMEVKSAAGTLPGAALWETIKPSRLASWLR